MYPLQCCETDGRINVVGIFSIWLIFPDTFMVEDAVEAIGFGTFQWKLSILTGLSWVSFYPLQIPVNVNILCHDHCVWLACFVSTDGRRHGDDDPQHLSSTAPLRMETSQPGGGTAHIGNGSLASAHKRACCIKICHYCSLFISAGCVYWDDDQLFSLGKHIW